MKKRRFEKREKNGKLDKKKLESWKKTRKIGKSTKLKENRQN